MLTGIVMFSKVYVGLWPSLHLPTWMLHDCIYWTSRCVIRKWIFCCSLKWRLFLESKMEAKKQPFLKLQLPLHAFYTKLSSTIIIFMPMLQSYCKTTMFRDHGILVYGKWLFPFNLQRVLITKVGVDLGVPMMLTDFGESTNIVLAKKSHVE